MRGTRYAGRSHIDHLLAEHDRRNALDNVPAHLDSGGRFVFNATVWEFEGNDLTAAGVEERGQRRYERHVARDVDGDDIDVRWVYRIFEDGEPVEEIEQPSTIVRSDPESARKLAEAAGLRIVDERRAFTDEQFRPGESYWLVLDTRARYGSLEESDTGRTSQHSRERTGHPDG